MAELRGVGPGVLCSLRMGAAVPASTLLFDLLESGELANAVAPRSRTQGQELRLHGMLHVWLRDLGRPLVRLLCEWSRPRGLTRTPEKQEAAERDPTAPVRVLLAPRIRERFAAGFGSSSRPRSKKITPSARFARACRGNLEARSVDVRPAPAAGTRSTRSRRLRARRRDGSRGGHQAETRRRRAMCQMARTISAPITLPTIPVGWMAEVSAVRSWKRKLARKPPTKDPRFRE